MSTEWKDEVTEHLAKYREERAELISCLSTVIGEFAPSVYGVKADFDEIKAFPYTARVKLIFKGAGDIQFEVSKDILSAYNLIKDEVGFSRAHKPATSEEIQNSIRIMIVTEVKKQIRA
ncbi:hypothetical protein [Paenibacillus odorifer]|uniref:Uncharacterized protein n=1 Tax=Paenibacillus odorifer TaxID=189426 RepID=A0A1R0Y5F2_9BACL|nr:hypothetical protein [Paenibacillus odorifer]OMD42577.1 hypothetical protein BSK52_07140 [Paenibacillus odorifer]